MGRARSGRLEPFCRGAPQILMLSEEGARAHAEARVGTKVVAHALLVPAESSLTDCSTYPGGVECSDALWSGLLDSAAIGASGAAALLFLSCSAFSAAKCPAVELVVS